MPEQTSHKTVWERLDDGGEGRKVVTLMGDPEGGDSLFVSLVNRGANRRPFAVVKADDAPYTAPDDAQPSGAGSEGAGGWFKRLLASLGGWGTGVAQPADSAPAMKGNTDAQKAATSFGVAVAAERLDDELWDAHWVLKRVIGEILMLEDGQDRTLLIARALDEFGLHVMSMVTPALGAVLKADRVAVAKAVEGWRGQDDPRPLVAKAGRVISAANMQTIKGAKVQLEEALAALAALEALDVQAGADNTDAASKADASEEDADVIKIQTLKEAAEAAQVAAEGAVKVAKSVNPKATEADLQKIAVEAYSAAYKMAVQGPPQPALMPNNLDKQLGDLDSQGNPGSPVDAAAGALRSVTPGTSVALKGDDPATVERLIAVVKKQGEVIAALKGLPNAPKGGGEGGDPPPEVTQKGDGETFKGSAFDFTNL